MRTHNSSFVGRSRGPGGANSQDGWIDYLFRAFSKIESIYRRGTYKVDVHKLNLSWEHSSRKSSESRVALSREQERIFDIDGNRLCWKWSLRIISSETLDKKTRLLREYVKSCKLLDTVLFKLARPDYKTIHKGENGANGFLGGQTTNLRICIAMMAYWKV